MYDRSRSFKVFLLKATSYIKDAIINKQSSILVVSQFLENICDAAKMSCEVAALPLIAHANYGTWSIDFQYYALV